MATILLSQSASLARPSLYSRSSQGLFCSASASDGCQNTIVVAAHCHSNFPPTFRLRTESTSYNIPTSVTQNHPFSSCSAQRCGQSKNLNPSLLVRSKRRERHVLVTVSATASAAERSSATGESQEKKVAIVWFKHDLRLDDHPGLAAASEYQHVLPLYIFDPYVCSGWSKEQLEGLFDAVADLKTSLRNVGSDLVVLSGRTTDVLYPLAQKIGAASIISEEEVESQWVDLVDSVSDSMSEDSSADKMARLKHWSASLYHTERVKEIPDNYKEFKRLRLPIVAPLESLTSLPGLPEDTDPGALPGFDEFYDNISAIRKQDSCWESLQAAPAATLLPQRNSSQSTVSPSEYGAFKGLRDWREKYILESPQASLMRKIKEGGLEEVEQVIGTYVIKGGATGALNVLAGYLRFLEPTGRDDWKAVYEHIWEMEKKPGASFRTLFGTSLALGTISRRRVLFEALKYEKERNGGRLSPFGFSTFTVEAAVADVKSMEWFELLQKKSIDQAAEKGFKVSAWRWRGYHIQYSMMGSEGPAAVLVHGFGAFWEHYRSNLRGLAEKGYRVWALTLVGFGRSEKPNITYTELVWAELVRDFIVEVVGEPVILAGNSIGGFTTTIVAGLWPALVKSLVLLNTAGKVVPDYKNLTYNKPRESSAIARPVSQLLLFYLQISSDKLLTRCYPKVLLKPLFVTSDEKYENASRVDDWLLGEVKRGVSRQCTKVLESVFLLRAPLPLNFYIDRYQGKVLVIQGTADPLQKNSNRVPMLQALCSNVTVKYLDAGHCPHDELPDEVNSLVHDFVMNLELASQPVISESVEAAAGQEDTAAATVAEMVIEEIKLVNEDLAATTLPSQKQE